MNITPSVVTVNEMNSDVIESHHALIASRLNEALKATEVNLVTPFHLETEKDGRRYNIISGLFTFPNGAEYWWNFSGGDGKTLDQLEREINLDLVKAFFHNQLAKGYIKTRNFFAIQHMRYLNPSAMVLLVSTKWFFKDHRVFRINLEEHDVYDFKTGKLNVKKLDDIVTEMLKKPPKEKAVMPTIGDVFGQFYIRKILETDARELDGGVPLKRRRVTKDTDSMQIPFVTFVH